MGLAAAAPLILASASAARRALLEAALSPTLRFTVQAASVDEVATKRRMQAAGASPQDAALALADAKAAAVPAGDAIVIGADQVLVCGGRWFDKPRDLAEVGGHLRALRGRTHGLATAAVCRRDGAAVWQHVETPELTMRAVSDRFIDAYLAAEGEACLSSVGGYRLEGLGIQLFDAVLGDHSAILGLPLLPLLAFLRGQGVLLR